jgi:hypothetical protein
MGICILRDKQQMGIGILRDKQQMGIGILRDKQQIGVLRMYAVEGQVVIKATRKILCFYLLCIKLC